MTTPAQLRGQERNSAGGRTIWSGSPWAIDPRPPTLNWASARRRRGPSPTSSGLSSPPAFSSSARAVLNWGANANDAARHCGPPYRQAKRGRGVAGRVSSINRARHTRRAFALHEDNRRVPDFSGRRHALDRCGRNDRAGGVPAVSRDLIFACDPAVPSFSP
jgi:hypothetical protein